MVSRVAVTLVSVVVACSAWLIGRYVLLKAPENRFLSADKDVPTASSPPKAGLLTLAWVDPVKVGHIREVRFSEGEVRQMKTLSVRPALFEIENFLSPDECDDIIFMATTQGLETSRTLIDGALRLNESTLHDMFHNPDKSFEQADANEDGVLDKSELSLGISHLGDILLTGKDLDDLIKDLELDADQDGVLTRQEYRTLVIDGKLQLIINYTAAIKEKAPRMRTRLSNTAFLDPLEHVGHRKLFDNLRQRIQDVTGLQKDIIWTSENLQVLRYDKDGHYHCHYDSEDENKHPDIPCCHYSNHEDDEDCLPCRYMTFFYYLNEPEEGGETAFPIADDQIDAPERMLREDQHLCDLSRYCNQSRIRYKPKQGTALFWYNHHRDEETGWLGDVDKMSYHGGCDVTKGTKWAANSWINVGKSREHDIEAWESYKVFVEDYDKLSNKTDEKTDVDANPGPGAVAENAERASEVDERIETAGAGN